ncbi:MAG: hypothetical protein NHB14_10265 [Desulfosporosinus sp.]|nr:hypothetical protein [Desulfosporosinus sp.]
MRYRFIGRILQEQWPNMIGTVAGCHRIAGRMPQEYSYNVQIGVEGEYIVGIDVSSERSDQLTLILVQILLSHLFSKVKRSCLFMNVLRHHYETAS